MAPLIGKDVFLVLDIQNTLVDVERTAGLVFHWFRHESCLGRAKIYTTPVLDNSLQTRLVDYCKVSTKRCLSRPTGQTLSLCNTRASGKAASDPRKDPCKKKGREVAPRLLMWAALGLMRGALQIQGDIVVSRKQYYYHETLHDTKTQKCTKEGWFTERQARRKLRVHH